MMALKLNFALQRLKDVVAGARDGNEVFDAIKTWLVDWHEIKDKSGISWTLLREGLPFQVVIGRHGQGNDIRFDGCNDFPICDRTSEIQLDYIISRITMEIDEWLDKHSPLKGDVWMTNTERLHQKYPKSSEFCEIIPAIKDTKQNGVANSMKRGPQEPDAADSGLSASKSNTEAGRDPSGCEPQLKKNEEAVRQIDETSVHRARQSCKGGRPAKLTPDQIEELLQTVADPNDNRTQAELAKHFSVDRTTIGRILKRYLR